MISPVLERGAGVARDYAQAAAIYRQQCDEGRGDRVACRALIRALNEARGVDHSRSRVQHATRLIRDGQWIRVHGTDGYVEILSGPGQPDQAESLIELPESWAGVAGRGAR